MSISRRQIIAMLPLAGAMAIFTIAVSSPQSAPAQPTQFEPIGYIGHGAMFDAKGKQIVPTTEFVQNAQRWYRDKIMQTLPREKKQRMEAQERTIKSLSFDGQEKLFLISSGSNSW